MTNMHERPRKIIPPFLFSCTEKEKERGRGEREREKEIERENRELLSAGVIAFWEDEQCFGIFKNDNGMAFAQYP